MAEDLYLSGFEERSESWNGYCLALKRELI